ncbi:MAG: PQQ-binding-like beta-propeller repeat protein [Acidobacteriota bacterium]|nr:PQQ-binding-like beta-propeller repeat protein [Acidobacteriota bacterium]
MLNRSLGALLVAGLLALTFAAPRISAQNLPTDAVNSPNNYPPVLPEREGPPPPRLVFLTMEEVALPGQLSEHPLAVEGEEITLPVAGGRAWVRLKPDPRVRVVPGATPVAGQGGDESWVYSEDGRARFRSLAEGRVEAEVYAPNKDEWRPDWSFRVGGAVLAPPVVDGERLFFGSLDDQVYAVRSDNGHLLWADDVGARVSRPLGLWRGELLPEEPDEIPREYALIIVVPDDGSTIQALDSHDGQRVAFLEMPEFEPGLVSPPLVDSEGAIVVARQKYEAADAALMVYRLAPPEPAPEADADEEQVAYNDPAPSPEGGSE